MRWIAILLIGWFLQGCVIFENKPSGVNKLLSVPKAWQIQGRLGVVIDGKSQNSGFKLEFKQSHYQLTLSAPLGLGKIEIISTEQGLLIDGKKVDSNFRDWMLQELDWYFPIQKLSAIVFLHQEKIDADWQVNIVNYQQINQISYPKIVRLNHATSPINIKLLIGEVNQLK